MKSLFFFFVATWATLGFAEVPDPVISTLSSYNGHATIAGRLATQISAPVGISVRNGNITYSTITDTEGRWAIVIRHLGVNVSVQSWDLKVPSTRSIENVFPLRAGKTIENDENANHRSTP